MCPECLFYTQDAVHEVFYDVAFSGFVYEIYQSGIPW